jgi:hypothetical protein
MVCKKGRKAHWFICSLVICSLVLFIAAKPYGLAACQDQ